MTTQIKIKSCPTCGSDKIKLVHRKWQGEYKGQIYDVPNLKLYECSDCEERIYDREAMQRIETCSPAFLLRKPSRKSA